MTSKVLMVGCGKLGLPCAEEMSLKHDVTGYDIRPVLSARIPIEYDLETAIKDKEIIFVAIPTPHDYEYDGNAPTSHLPPKNFDYDIVKKCLEDINKYVNKNQLVVLISTVLPGTVRTHLQACITNARFIYNPYLIAMGTVKHDFVNPEMVIIGTEDGNKTGDAKLLVDFYETLMHKDDTRYEIGTWDEAECIKIFYNTFISTKIALVNMIQDVAMKQGNINCDVVTNALANSTQRIMGKQYMTAGMGDAGGCHPRDNIALRWLADDLNMGYDLFDSIMLAREIQARNMAQYLLTFNLPVVIVGKSYKPLITLTDGSSSMLVGHFVEQEQELYYLDPPCGEYPPEDLGASVFLLAHNVNVTYGNGCVEENERTYPKGSIIVDPWRTTKPIDGCTVIHYGNTRNTL